MAAMSQGDVAALNTLIQRHDRLVRYVAFRVGRRRASLDPQWIDSVASDTWLGFAKQMQKDGRSASGSAAALLTRIARNRAVSALRRDLTSVHAAVTSSLETTDDGQISTDDAVDDPAEFAARIDLLEKLQSCLLDLDERDRDLASQLDAITARRWKEAATGLGISESTLRSRWKRVESLLRVCLEQKTGKLFAPESDSGDS